MSKDLELQQILQNGRHSSPDKMSGSGSFTTSTSHDISTDMVGSVPPVYSTVPEAKADHGRYQVQQVKNAQRASQLEYTSPTGMDPPNEYDMIPDNSKRSGRSHSPGVPLMAENVLYGDPMSEENLRHRSITVEKAASERQQPRRYTGSTSSQVVKEPADGGGMCTGRCCGVCLMLVLVFVVAFIAVAALVLVLSIMLKVYPVCDCTNSESVHTLTLTLSLTHSLTHSLSLSLSHSLTHSLSHSLSLSLSPSLSLSLSLSLSVSYTQGS